MDEQKQAEASEEKPEQLGPYQLQEQVPQAARSQEELYLATHETSGATALVLKLNAEQDAAELKDWRVSLISSSTPPGYVAMQVEQTPWSRAPDRQSAESLVFTFESVREAVRRMARAVPENYESRPPVAPGAGRSKRSRGVRPAPGAGASGPRVPTLKRPGAINERSASAKRPGQADRGL